VARRKLSAGERRERIIESAIGLFSQKGFKGTTTREIAEGAGISEAMVFRYFPTKEDLYAAIITRAAGDVFEEISLIEFISRKDDAGLLRALATDMMTRYEDDPSFLRLLYYSALEGHYLSEMFFQMRVRQKIQTLADYIAQRSKDGAFREVEPTLTAMGFLGMVVQFIIGRELFGLKRVWAFPREQAVDTFVNLFLSGLRKT
jgi:AcrR family transcriptional regulator